MFKWLCEEPKTDKELQAELRALANTILVQQVMWPSDSRRYEELLREIYKRGLEPEITLKPKE